MKILFLSPYVPSKRAGGENFTRLLLADLARENSIDLIYYKYKDDAEYMPASDNIKVLKVLENSTWIKLWNYANHPSVHPIFAIRFNRNLLTFLKKKIEERNYDLVYLDHSQMFLYGKYLKDIPKILMAHDVMAQRYERQGNAMMRKLVLKSEGDLMRIPNSTVFSFSEKDQNIIKRLYGIDSEVTHFFLDEMVVNATPTKIEKRLVFFGKWKRADNYDGLVWFFENVYPLLDKDFKISIIGGWLPEDFKQKYVDDRVEYLGFVDNPYTLIANSIAVLSPLFSGAGVKVKVVESLACGTPVIGNDIAFEGITGGTTDFMLKADVVNDYIKLIIYASQIQIQERQAFKKTFLENYSLQSITNWLALHKKNYQNKIVMGGNNSKPLHEIYDQRSNFIIVALTGITGSGCSAFAEVMASPFEKWEELIRKPNELKADSKNKQDEVFKRKYELCYHVCEKQAEPFAIIKYRNVLLECMIEQLCKEYENNKDFYNVFIKVIKDKFDKSHSYDTGYPAVKNDFSVEELQKLGLTVELITKFREFIGKEKEDYRIHLYEIVMGDDSPFKIFCEKFYDELKERDYYAKNFFVHRLGNALRAANDVRAIVDENNKYSNDNIFTNVEKINDIVKGCHIVAPNKPRRFVIDSVRNSLEIMYLRERYNAFYMVALHNDGYEKELVTKKVSSVEHNKKRRKEIVSRIISLNEKEADTESFDNAEFYGPDIKRCVTESQIHIHYKEKGDRKRMSFYSYGEQWMKFYALILRPGLITPSRDERCMSIAYVAKFNSGCLSRQVGCTIVDKDYAVQSVGWNDPPASQLPCSLRYADELETTTCNNIFSEFEISNIEQESKNKENFVFKEKIKVDFEALCNKTKEYGLRAPYCFRTKYNEYKGNKDQVNTRSLHAEENTMLRISRNGGIGLNGGTMYVTASPCVLCSKKAFQIGIKDIVYLDPYTDIAPDLILHCGYDQPQLRPFAGAIGETYYKLYQPFIPYKDELTMFKKIMVKEGGEL